MPGCVGSGVVTPFVGVGVVGGTEVLEGVGVEPMRPTQTFVFAHRPSQLDPIPVFQAKSCAKVIPFSVATSVHPWFLLTK